MSAIAQIAVLLAAAVIAVPISKRLGLGSILGYLAAGIAIGPFGLALFTDVESILHAAELGVVLLLFIIGLELQPSRLMVMRRAILGLGAAQVAVTGILIAGAGIALGLRWLPAVVVGLGLALSSTAFALQILAERKQLTTGHGRAAFSILLFQDIAAIPLIAAVSFLGPAATGGAPGEGIPWLGALRVVAVLVGVFVGGHYLLRPLFRVVAGTRLPEVFTALSLLVVVGTALVVQAAGLSMALGAFLAGVLLADSEYRHALEADIEPFKGLLLGLFFIAVGMSVDLGLLASSPGTVLGLAAGLVAVKAVVLLAIGRASGLPLASAGVLAAALGQGGEFAFVVFGVGAESDVIPTELASLLILVVGVSMAATPFCYAAAASMVRATKKRRPVAEYDRIPDDEHPAIIAGFGRFGQVVGRVLRARGIGFTALEINPEQVDFVKRYGNKVYYGDAARLDLLRAAGAHRAAIFVLAIDDVDASVRAARTVAENFPGLAIYARARNRQHAYRLIDVGVKVIRRETFLASLDMAREVLVELGLSEYESRKTVRAFRRQDRRRLYREYPHYSDEEKLVQLARRAEDELAEQFERDASLT